MHSFLIRRFPSFLPVALLVPGLFAASAAGAPAVNPLDPAGTGGVAAVDRALARLSTHRRLLIVAAHPDDEDTSLLALVARGQGGEAAYLALSRGEGGQNLIGPELGVGLGLVRSRELEAARQIDGARQFFSRAYDFGYTRSLEETFDRWPRGVLLEDVVRVIRRFRPQVMVSVFPGAPVRTHGQHQAAGVTAHEAFRLAGDPEAFPRLTAEGLAPWQPLALYRSTWFDPESTTLELETGTLDPLTGRSVFQLAMASRSRHRSQDMGVLQPLGPRQSRLGWVAGAGSTEAEDLFTGIDTGLAALAATLPEGEARRKVESHLEHAGNAARRAREGLVAAAPEGAAAALPAILKDLRSTLDLLTTVEPWGAAAWEAAAVARLVEEKIDIAEEALAAAAGVAADAVADREELVPGAELTVDASVWNAGGGKVELTGVELTTPGFWRVRPAEVETGDRRGFFGTAPTRTTTGPLVAGDLYQGRFAVAVTETAEPSIPYFLHRPLMGDLYDWSEVPGALRGEPFEAPLLTARFRLTLGGTEVGLEREVVARFRDQAVGEVRRPLRVVPAVEVSAEPQMLIWSTAERQPHRLEVALTSHLPGTAAGHLEVAVPAGWPAVAPLPFEIPGPGSPEVLAVRLAPPEPLVPGRFRVGVTAVLDDGRRFGLAVPVVDYEHIRPAPWPRPAAVEVSVGDIRVPPLSRVGYVRGASDRVPELLAEIGVPLEVLGARELLEGSLDGYDALVVGSRAYETDPALARANGRLLGWVRRGGLLIVQYQQYPFVEGGFAPFPLEIHRPHDRVTDETAPVRMLLPNHPVFHVPNQIDPADWEGWVQERGLYFAGTWDEAYTPLLAMADPGGPELEGSLLVAPVGEGTWVYTGLAFFRQLPAGVPGAYRLFANLLGLGAGRD